MGVMLNHGSQQGAGMIQLLPFGIWPRRRLLLGDAHLCAQGSAQHLVMEEERGPAPRGGEGSSAAPPLAPGHLRQCFSR